VVVGGDIRPSAAALLRDVHTYTVLQSVSLNVVVRFEFDGDLHFLHYVDITNEVVNARTLLDLPVAIFTCLTIYLLAKHQQLAISTIECELAELERSMKVDENCAKVR
jgi:hypothetical protein